MMRHGWTKFGGAGIAVALLVVGTVSYLRSDRNAAPAAAPQPVPVIAATVQQHDVPIILTGLGTVTALNTATVRSQVTGQLISVDFQEGQTVHKGEVLARIDPRTYQAQLDQAEAALGHDQAHLANAQLNLKRYEPLANEGATTEQQLAGQQSAVAELQSTIKADQAAVDNAKAQLSYTSLTAPFDGITGIRLLDVGNVVQATTTSDPAPPIRSRYPRSILKMPRRQAARLPQRCRDVTAIDRGDVRGRLQRQRVVHKRLCDIVGRHLAAEQIARHVVVLGHAAGLGALRDEVRGDQAGPDAIWVDRIGADAVGAVVERVLAHQEQRRRFGQAVRAEAGAGIDRLL
jgi:multidrug efflux pump subunit AcrA (membrane-fusion protein)